MATSALSYYMEDYNFVSTLRKTHEDFRNIYIQREPFADDIPWRRHQNLCDSTQGAPSLVPTCSEVCVGSNAWELVHNRRICILLKRIETALDAMEMLLRQKPKEPDGKEELERRHIRSVEFVSRFSRNYLFQLRMQVMELKRQLQHISLASPGKHSRHQLLLKKLVTTYQTAVQGLQACLNQLPGSGIDPVILNKLDELLCYICELSSLKNHVDMNTFSIGSEDSPRQDNIKKKAENLIVIVRRRKKERETAFQNWRKTASSLAKKRFGLPSTAKGRIGSRSNIQQEKILLNKAERGVRKKRLRTSTIRTHLQGGDCELLPSDFNNFDQREDKIDDEKDAPLDPTTALELKIIMSRMKDILRGAHLKPSPSPKPTYPPNVGLVFMTHEEVSHTEETHKERDEHGHDVQTQEENHPNEPTNCEELQPNRRSSHSQAAPQSDASLDSAGLMNVDRDEVRQKERPVESECLPSAFSASKNDPNKISAETVDDNAFNHKVNARENSKNEETRSSVSTTRLRRKLTPQEQRIVMYRNRYRAYKEHVRHIQLASEQLLSTVFREVANELEPSILLDKMYHLELQG